MKRIIIYYLTEDLNNQKIINELNFLKEIANIVVITNIEARQELKEFKVIKIKKINKWMIVFQKLWPSFSFVLCKIAKTSSDQKFKTRNFYTGNYILRLIVNILFEFKKIKIINNILPTYDYLYFLPWNLKYLFSFTRESNSKKNINRLFIHDALLIRLGTLAGAVANARQKRIKTLGNVRSWDNPFYTQLSNRVDGYLVWSESMWQDIRAVHGVDEKPYFIWGARPFLPFLSTSKERGDRIRPLAIPPKKIFVGYAAAFCDDLMGIHEKDLIKIIAKFFESNDPSLVILFRPYPVMPDSFYDDLRNIRNIVIQKIKGASVDRYGDGREAIKFGSDEEKLSFLARCHCYLSIGTSFTIEAAIAKVPIVQLYLNPRNRIQISEKKIFERFDISDHLRKYFLSHLICVKNYSELAIKLRELSNINNSCCKIENSLIDNIGIDIKNQGFLKPNDKFKFKFKKFITEYKKF